MFMDTSKKHFNLLGVLTMYTKVLILGVLVSMPVLAQRVVDAEVQKRNELIKSLDRGRTIKIMEDEYQHLPKVLGAVKKNSSQPDAQVLTEVGAIDTDLIEKKGNFVLYKHGAGRNKAAVDKSGTSDTYPAMLNVKTGVIGLLTGTVVVFPKKMSDVESIGKTHGMEVVKAFPQINTVYYRVKADMDVLDVAAAVSSDKRVQKSYPEIIENLPVLQ